MGSQVNQLTSSFSAKEHQLKMHIAFVFALAVAAVLSQPIMDMTKDTHCAEYFPDRTTYVKSRLNDTIQHMVGPEFALAGEIDILLESVVLAEANACNKINAMMIAWIADHPNSTAPAPTTAS